MVAYTVHSHWKFKSNESGITLIELLITMFISALVLAVLMEMYLTCMRSFNLQNALYHLQNTAKEAAFIFATEFKKTGNIGCAHLSTDFPVTSYKQYTLTTRNKIIGNDSSLTFRYAEYPHATLRQSMHEYGKLYANQTVKFGKGDILIISNCARAEIFEVSQVKLSRGKQLITSLLPLHDLYEKDAEISLFNINKYYVNKTNRNDRHGYPIYSLFIENNRYGKSELIADIHKMQLSYTIEQSGQLKEVNAKEISNWADVKGVAVDLELVAFPFKKTWHFYSALRD